MSAPDNFTPGLVCFVLAELKDGWVAAIWWVFGMLLLTGVIDRITAGLYDRFHR